MSRILMSAVVLSMFSTSAFAYESNREDVARAKVSGEQLSTASKIALKSKVIVAEIVRANLVLAQMPINKVGLVHRNSPVSFLIGTGQASAIALAGMYATKTLATKNFGDLDRQVSAQYDTITKQNQWIKQEQAEVETLRAEARSKVQFAENEKLKNLEASVTNRQRALAEAETAVATSTKAAKWYKRMGRPTRIGLGAVVVPLTIVESAVSFIAVATVEQGDAVIRDLTQFIDDARATLEAQ